MTQNVKEEMIKNVNALLAAGSCCAEGKAAGQAWLDALGTDKEAEASKNLIAEMEADITSIDGLIAFAESEHGKQVFGDQAAAVAAHAKESKAAGAVYCDCPACAAAEAILKLKDELL